MSERGTGLTPYSQRLRRRRVELALSQKAVAAQVGVGQDVISRIERAEYIGSDETGGGGGICLRWAERPS